MKVSIFSCLLAAAVVGTAVSSARAGSVTLDATNVGAAAVGSGSGFVTDFTTNTGTEVVTFSEHLTGGTLVATSLTVTADSGIGLLFDGGPLPTLNLATLSGHLYYTGNAVTGGDITYTDGTGSTFTTTIQGGGTSTLDTLTGTGHYDGVAGPGGSLSQGFFAGVDLTGFKTILPGLTSTNADVGIELSFDASGNVTSPDASIKLLYNFQGTSNVMPLPASVSGGAVGLLALGAMGLLRRRKLAL